MVSFLVCFLQERSCFVLSETSFKFIHTHFYFTTLTTPKLVFQQLSTSASVKTKKNSHDKKDYCKHSKHHLQNRNLGFSGYSVLFYIYTLVLGCILFLSPFHIDNSPILQTLTVSIMRGGGNDKTIQNNCFSSLVPFAQRIIAIK